MTKTCWYTLGFTADDVTIAWQHWRLAMEFHRALEAEGLPPSFGVVEAPGESAHMIYWFVSAETVRVLDRHDVGWRRFLVRMDLAPPRQSHAALSGVGHLQK